MFKFPSKQPVSSQPLPLQSESFKPELNLPEDLDFAAFFSVMDGDNPDNLAGESTHVETSLPKDQDCNLTEQDWEIIEGIFGVIPKEPMPLQCPAEPSGMPAFTPQADSENVAFGLAFTNSAPFSHGLYSSQTSQTVTFEPLVEQQPRAASPMPTLAQLQKAEKRAQYNRDSAALSRKKQKEHKERVKSQLQEALGKNFELKQKLSGLIKGVPESQVVQQSTDIISGMLSPTLTPSFDAAQGGALINKPTKKYTSTRGLTPEEKKALRREKNAASAAGSRVRKKEEMRDMEAQLQNTHASNIALETEIACLVSQEVAKASYSHKKPSFN